MALLHVFLVDTGLMMKLDMQLAAENVSVLMGSIYEKTFITPSNQVLITANGEPLNPEKCVASYVSVGTESHPIFLFSKSSIQSAIPPSPSINLGSEKSLKEEVDACAKMPPIYETLVTRAKLASDFQKFAFELYESCENLVNDQNFQSLGWSAVIMNLDHITEAFHRHLMSFEEYYRGFFSMKSHYNNMLLSFSKVLIWLEKLPLLPCLTTKNEKRSLLEWINTYDQQSSLENLLRQCQESIKQLNFEVYEKVVDDAQQILESAQNPNMKEIRGLADRLVNLQQRLHLANQLKQDQSDMAQGFQQNKMRAEHLGDSSVLPDLCSSHQKQLHVLIKNHCHLREIRNLCARAKDELSVNLHTRLKWVMTIEKQICSLNSKIVIYHDFLKKIKKRMDIFEQVYDAPKLYVLSVIEVVRRRHFSKQFCEWAKSVAESSKITRNEEIQRRQVFQQVFRQHFVQSLIPGLDRLPTPFAEDLPVSCDNELPEIQVEDIQFIQQHVPDLVSEMNMSDIMLTSTQVQHCLSQDNLQKLAQEIPDVYFNETQFDQKLTMSALKREISAVNEEFPFYEDPPFRESTVNTDDENSDFDPVSLSSLADDKSDDSDALFQSAEMDLSDNTTPVISPVLGKSSSVPIDIKLSSKSTHDELDFISDSPLSKNIFSPNNVSSSSSPLIKSFKNLKNNSNNSLSLAKALKCTQVTNTQSSNLFLNACKEVLLLKSNLCNAQTDFQIMYQITNKDLSNVKEQFLAICDTVLPAKCESCLLLQKDVDKLIDENNQFKKNYDKLSLESLNLNELLKAKVEASDLINKLEIEVKNSNTRIQDLQIQVENLNKNLDYLYSQEQKYCNEKLQVCSELDKCKLELSTKSQEYDSQITVARNDLSNLQNKLHTQESSFLQKQAALHSEIQSKDIEMQKLNETIFSLSEKIKENEDNYNSSANNYKCQIDTISAEHNKSLNEIAQLTNQLKDWECKLVTTQGLLATTQSTLTTTQQTNESNLEHISVLNLQIKKLKQLLNEKHKEISQAKDHLEYQKQLNFNQVINKIKKEKDIQIQDAQAKCTQFEKEIVLLKLKIENLNQEITTHKDGFSLYEDDVKKMKQTMMADIENLKKEIIELKNSNKSLKYENEQLSCDNKRISAEVIRISEENTCLTASVDEIAQEKLRVIQELKVQYNEALEKEKKNILLSFELEKVSIMEKCGRSEHMIRASSSLEEGIDELEVDRLVEKVKILEEENTKLKNSIESLWKEKITWKKISIGDAIIVAYDESIKQYVALSDQTCFVHPESLKQIFNASSQKQFPRWMLVYVTNTEICLAKKSGNKLNLPADTMFLRVHVMLYSDPK
ncbi:RB1-inducible coiled-coil protein 1 isoform X9 [Hydra vulgaris]|uniref:RB1-inducible coiled-coil protein 1 isoform X9 n=1 Tax=Hydra vulgaris TaxID=6087 RepID=A0ABM4DH74_HYDVU